MVVPRRHIFSLWPYLLDCAEGGVVHLLLQLIVPHLGVLEHLLHGVHRAEGEAGRLQIVSDGMKFFTTREHLPGELAHLSSKKYLENYSVADPGCLSRIPDPDFYPSRIQKQLQKRGVKKIYCHTFYCTYKFHKKLKLFYF
jgi:hypothetical protein